MSFLFTPRDLPSWPFQFPSFRRTRNLHRRWNGENKSKLASAKRLHHQSCLFLFRALKSSSTAIGVCPARWCVWSGKYPDYMGDPFAPSVGFTAFADTTIFCSTDVCRWPTQYYWGPPGAKGSFIFNQDYMYKIICITYWSFLECFKAVQTV